MQESKLRDADDEEGDGTNNVLAIFKKRTNELKAAIVDN